MRWVKSLFGGVREYSAGKGWWGVCQSRAKGVAWESVVEDGELVVGGSTVCVGSANLRKSEDDAATTRANEVDPHTQSRAGHQPHAELRIYVQVSLH